jgi:DNA-binding response OmpR family regulator
VKLLLVDDDHVLLQTLQRGLQAEGYTVDVAHDGDEGWWMATEGHHDAYVLDIMMPKRNGFRLCSDLRAAGNWTPILMLTAKHGELDQAEALDSGADDYLTKPFSFVVLLARLRALLRRAEVRAPAVLEVGDLRIDPSTRSAWRGATEVPLTSREFDVLEALMRRSPALMSKAELLASVWSFDYDGDGNIVEVFVRRLRNKIDTPFGRTTLATVRGGGYRLDPDG